MELYLNFNKEIQQLIKDLQAGKPLELSAEMIKLAHTVISMVECDHEWEHHFIEFTADDNANKMPPKISDISVCKNCNRVCFLRGTEIYQGDTKVISEVQSDF